jgi:predicted neutral ceramidase superfamily lipid hydrolase
MSLHGADTPLDGEAEKTRLDREASELFEEIRVALPGVQVLFAFLLALPFQSRWKHVSELQQDAYFAALCLALLASMLLIAPSAWHRTNFRRYDKRRLVVIATRSVLTSLALLALAMSAVLFVIADELFSTPAALGAAGVALIAFGIVWWLLPLRERAQYRSTVNE